MTQVKIDSIRERMCDGYCKWPNKFWHNIFLPIQIAQEKLNAVCRNCPLNELEASE